MEKQKPQNAPAQIKRPAEPKPPKLSPTVNKAPALAAKASAKKSVPNVTLPKSSVPSNPVVPTGTKAPMSQVSPKQVPVSPKPAVQAAKEPKGLLIQPWHLIVALVVVVALIVGGVFLGRYFGSQNTEDPIVDYTGTLVNNSPADPNGITLPGYSALTFFAKRNQVVLELPNPSGNPCYFRYTLTIVETGEEIYQSQLIEPGKMLKKLTLNQPLSEGPYTLRITIDTFSLADGTTPMNGGVQEVKLTVK